VTLLSISSINQYYFQFLFVLVLFCCTLVIDGCDNITDYCHPCHNQLAARSVQHILVFAVSCSANNTGLALPSGMSYDERKTIFRHIGRVLPKIYDKAFTAPIEDLFYARFYAVQPWRERGAGCEAAVVTHILHPQCSNFAANGPTNFPAHTSSLPTGSSGARFSTSESAISTANSIDI